MNMVPVFQALVVLHAVAVTMLSFSESSPDAPPTTAGPETTDESQLSVLVGFVFSPVQIEQFFADAKFIYEKYKPVWVANEVTETTMYDTLQKLYKEFTTMIAFFPFFWKICGFGFTRVVNFFFLKYFGQSGLELWAIKFFLRLTMFFLELFEPILYLLWG